MMEPWREVEFYIVAFGRKGNRGRQGGDTAYSLLYSLSPSA